ncbi:hypothetical protein TI39_contig5877g00003 [Zymoseptoria brevis]|uniref:TauD/TfdA-like domain-containing protein n=1 Tax=Zymoseptoria brevis TaxID=1047168 RepID=A0A0F4G4J2_9PEZI|nr:hypothetical protein TI39_contig5877g00003 [Zymoseptoria brevis]
MGRSSSAADTLLIILGWAGRSHSRIQITAPYATSYRNLWATFIMVAIKESYWAVLSKDYQKSLQIIRGSDEPVISFPLVLEPRISETSKDEVLKEARKLGARPDDIDLHSGIRKLLDTNGGAIHFKNLPLKSAEDFSDFMFALAGTGKYAWTPHEHVGMEVLRRPQAKNVLTANEGPPSHFIGWHNEYAVSPVHPHYLALYCNVKPGSGGETSVSNSNALYDRLKTEAPGFVEGCARKGLVYHIPHNAEQVGGIVGGNGLYKDSAFGPKAGEQLPETEEGRRAMVEAKILDLAQRGGWHKDIDTTNGEEPVWRRRGFEWTWRDNGDLDVIHRVSGCCEHPVTRRPGIFNVRIDRNG